MASLKTTSIGVAILLLLAGLGIGGAYLTSYLGQRAVRRDLTLAESYLAQGKPQDAERLLAPRTDQARPSAGWLPGALALRLQTLEQLKDAGALRALAERILNPERPLAKPGQEAWARAHIVLGQAQLEQSPATAAQMTQAREHFSAVLAQANAPWGRPEATLGLARLDMAAGKVPQAREQLQALYDSLPPEHPSRRGVEAALGRCNLALLLSPEPGPEDQVYVLQKGDSLDKIRKKPEFRGVSAELLMRVNNIPDPRRLTIGRRLKVPKTEFSIVVNKSDNTLTLHNFGKFFKKYRVRTGKTDYLTPVGEFKIQNKVKNPPWDNPKDNKHYAPGDPQNELGVRWMAFQGSSLGIHEAVDPATIGQYASNGCVGLVRQEVEELYDLVPLGTPVKIEGQVTQP